MKRTIIAAAALAVMLAGPAGAQAPQVRPMYCEAGLVSLHGARFSDVDKYGSAGWHRIIVRWETIVSVHAYGGDNAPFPGPIITTTNGEMFLFDARQWVEMVRCLERE